MMRRHVFYSSSCSSAFLHRCSAQQTLQSPLCTQSKFNDQHCTLLFSLREQSSSSSNNNNDINSGAHDRQGGIHTFIRNYQRQNQRASSYPNASTYNSRQNQTNTNVNSNSSSSSSSSSSLQSWAARLHRELYSQVDPLGGMAHKDYYRDPAKGFTPQYAPRNFGCINNSDNGSIEYTHNNNNNNSSSNNNNTNRSTSTTITTTNATNANNSNNTNNSYTSNNVNDRYGNALAWRNWIAHDVEQFTQHAKSTRQVMRSLTYGNEQASYVASYSLPLDRYRSHVPRSTLSSSIPELIEHSTVTGEDKTRQQLVLSRFDVAQSVLSVPQQQKPPQSNSTMALTTTTMKIASPVSFADTLPGEALSTRYVEQHRTIEDNRLAQQLYKAHGLREKQRFDFSTLQRTSRLPFEGYDMDRFKAQQRGTPYGATQLPPLSTPSSITEAQAKLRQNTVPPALEQIAQRSYAANTVANEPQLGQSLTQQIVQQLKLSKQAQMQNAQKMRNEKFGFGRQGPLVQDGGPDKREIKKHTNDEQIVNALWFNGNAYRQSATDEHTNPYERNNTQDGVGHLLLNSFDLARREDRVGHQLPDLTERSIMYLGVALPQLMDEYVLRHRNARGERPLDYFKPFPSFRAQRLNKMYQDTQGFSLIRSRPQMLQWQLFTRYRAHHQQRRALALLHGLEPVQNEIANERDARRSALDTLCEQTPFDESYLVRQDDDIEVDAETLRSMFGAYLLPSPSIVRATLAVHGSVNVHLHHIQDEWNGNDTREHVLSSRYLNKLLMYEAVQNRLGRLFVNEVHGRAPQPVIQYAQPSETLRQFSNSQRAMYNEYVANETKQQLSQWQRVMHGRRFIAQKNQFGEVCGASHSIPVVDVCNVDTTDNNSTTTTTTTTMTISVNRFANQLGQMLAKHEAGKVNNNNNINNTKVQLQPHTFITIDEAQYYVLPNTIRHVIPLAIRLECGEIINMTDELFSSCPLQVSASTLHNHALNYGIGSYHYNRGNYIETQDVLWEKATSQGVEGWSPATHADGLRVGLPVRARRHLGVVQQNIFAQPLSKSNNHNYYNNNNNNIYVSSQQQRQKKTTENVNIVNSNSVAASPIVTNMQADAAKAVMTFGKRAVGDYERGRIVSYYKQPFFNPEPRVVTVQFASDKHVQQVPLSDILIWQRQYYGPERTVGDASRRYYPSGARRYVDVADPNNEKQKGLFNVCSNAYSGAAGGGNNNTHNNNNLSGEHFLDKYLINNRTFNELKTQKARSTKQVTQLDKWTAFDLQRSDNYRPLGISQRHDYVKQGYFHRFTPWEWIAIQSGDQPLIAETIREDNVGPSLYFSLNRYWRYKARPHEYIRNFEHEVRDLFQYVDGVTPWSQAQKLRTYWEVRSHHPLPQFNRPEVAMHRNIPALLPTQLWDSDKKTGKVKGVKDSVRDYQTKTPFPKWVQL